MQSGLEPEHLGRLEFFLMSFLVSAGCFLTAFLFVACFNWLGLIAWRKTGGQHWTQRARVLWPVRKTSVLMMIYVPVLVTALSTMISTTSTGGLVLRGVFALVGGVGGCWFMNKEMFPGLKLSCWLHDVSVGLGLRLGIWLVVIGVGFMMPEDFGPVTWLMLGGVVVAQVLWSMVALQLLKALGILRPAGERLQRIVADCTKDDVHKVKETFQASGIHANAFAMPLSGRLLFMDRLMEILSDEEVSAICSHEVGHLGESGATIFGRYLGAMAVLPLLLIRPAANRWQYTGILGMALLTIAWSRLSRKLVRRMETRADQIAHGQQSGEGVYARALEKIYEFNHLPAVTGKNTSHPDLYDRMMAAGVTPDFPRPLPPRRFTWLGWLMLIALPVTIALTLMREGPQVPRDHPSKRRPRFDVSSPPQRRSDYPS